MQLLQDLARAYAALTQFECQRAIELFSSLPARHYNTGWVLCNMARAYFELCDYRQVTVCSSYFTFHTENYFGHRKLAAWKVRQCLKSDSCQGNIRELAKSEAKLYDRLFSLLLLF